jgi:hypothetical protein
MSSALSAQHWDTSHLNVQTRKMTKQNLSQRRCFTYKEKCHNIADYPREEALEQVCQNRWVQFGKPDNPILIKKIRTSVQCNKGFKVALDKSISNNESNKRQSKDKASKIKH